jgi:hypothetical protein
MCATIWSAPEKTAPPDRAKVEEKRRNGLNWCVCCKEVKPLAAFAEICAVSSAIDSSYDDVGLTVEDIDEYNF